MMQQLDDLAQNGEIHHYKVDTALYLALAHVDLTDDERSALLAYRAQIGARPKKAATAKIAQAALDFLNNVRSRVSGPNYSAIQYQLLSALADTQS